MRRLFAIGLACAAAFASCRGATQITLEVKTDFACRDLQDVAIAVAAPTIVETTPPVTVTAQCDPATGRVGALVLVPSGAKNEEIALRVVGRRSGDACDPPAYGPHCIVARRALRFVPHEDLALPVLLRASCEGIPCNPDETCADGECVPSAIDPSTCVPTCDESSLDLDGGHPPPRDAAPDVDAGAQAAAPFCPQVPGLLACFRFEGNLTDEGPARLVPSATANVTYAPGKRGQGIVITPSPATVVTFPSNEAWNQSAITIDAWIKMRSLPAAGARMGILDSNDRFGIFLEGDGFVHCRGVNADALTGAIPLNAWTHVACVYDGTNLIAFENGARTQSIMDTTYTSDSGTTNIGSDAPSDLDVLDGEIDDLRVWSRALSDAEIAAAAQ